MKRVAWRRFHSYLFMEKKKQRIAFLFLGGAISLYKDPETNGIFSISSQRDVEEYIPDLEKKAEVKVYANFPTRKTFLGMLDWKVVYDFIKGKRDSFDGFVIAQEIDSLLFAAGLFSYLFSAFGKPIIFTASPISLGEKRFQEMAKKNIEDSIAFATTDISEVAVCTNGKLLRACRARRGNIFSETLFFPSDIDPIGSIENGNPVVHLHRYNRNNSKRECHFLYPEKNILFIKMFPDFDLEYFDDILHRKHLDAIMIESLGHGSIKPSVLKAIEEISLSGIKVAILAKYDNNDRKFFLDADTINSPYIVLLKNIPTWAAYAKVHFAAQNSSSSLEFRKIMMNNIAGEVI